MTIERYPRSARRYHTAIYVVTLLLLASGWWLLTGREGAPSPIASITGVPDARLHVWLGWALVGVALIPLPFALRGVARFLRETFRYDQGDAGWLIRLPLAAITGRFSRHEGHFDPGQRIANVAIVILLVALVASGVGLVLVHAGPVFALLAAIHRISTIAFTVVIVGHIVVALGILPGYRGVWRSMHLGGRLRAETARRLWPGWTARQAYDVAAALWASGDGRPGSRPRPADTPGSIDQDPRSAVHSIVHVEAHARRHPMSDSPIATRVARRRQVILRIHVRSHRDRREAVPRGGRHRTRSRAARR